MATITQDLFDILPTFSNESEALDQRDKIETLLKNALSEPVNYPPLSESIFPGDRVTILVQNGLPAARQTLEGLLCVLEDSRIETQDILLSLIHI